MYTAEQLDKITKERVRKYIIEFITLNKLHEGTWHTPAQICDEYMSRFSDVMVEIDNRHDYMTDLANMCEELRTDVAECERLGITYDQLCWIKENGYWDIECWCELFHIDDLQDVLKDYYKDIEQGVWQKEN